MYSELNTKIGAILDTVDSVQYHTNFPITEINQWPYVYYQPAGYTNTFETNSQNARIYRYLLEVFVSVQGEKDGQPITTEEVFGTILPQVVDDIYAAFDAGWDQGVTSGSRLIFKIDSAEAWSVVKTNEAETCVAPLILEIKHLQTI
jgi:hypothetical protein